MTIKTTPAPVPAADEAGAPKNGPAILKEIMAAHPTELPHQLSARLSARLQRPHQETITPMEALRLVLAGELVTALDMAARADADGRFTLEEKELLNPESWTRGDGLPLVEVEGMAGALFSPAAVFSFMDEFLTPPPEARAQYEADQAEEERQKAEEKRHKEELEAKIMHDLEHPTPKRVIRSMSWNCAYLLDYLQKNARHRSKHVRAAAVKEARALMAELGPLVVDLQATA